MVYPLDRFTREPRPIQDWPRYTLPGTGRWLLYSLLSIVLCCFVMQPARIAAHDRTPAQDQPLVTVEMRYHMPEASEVTLVWGINGWISVSEEIRPTGTSLVNSVMHTPMLRKGNTFVAEVKVPACSTVDYGFLITEAADGATIKAWDGNTTSLVATQDAVVDVRAGLTLVGDQVMANVAGAQLVPQEIRYQAPGAGEVSLVWGINSWLPLPEEVRPAGTKLVEGIMHTLMEREGDVFVVQVQAPAGASVDYGFLTTKTRRGTATEIWDGNGHREQGYHTIAEQENVTEVQAPPSIAQKIAEADPEVVPSWLGLVLVTGVCAVLGTVMARTWILRRSGGAQAGIVDIERSLETPSRGRRLTYLYDLLRELVVRDMKLNYKRSVLGIVWSLLNPLFHMLVFIFLSRRVLRLDIPNYPSFVFTGLLVWNWFQSAVLMATGAITNNRELIRRPGFPVAILPVVTVTTNLIHFALALPVPLLFLVLGGGRLTGAILALPLVIALQFLLILGLGYLVATANVTFRDTQHLLAVFFMLLFYLTPVFYDANAVPARYHMLYRLNPMLHLITAYRAILIQGDLPDLRALLALGVLGGVLLQLGHAIFTRASIRFVEEL